MKKQLFKKLTLNEIKKSFGVGDKFLNAQVSYIDGYYKAAKVLAKISSSCFNYEKETLIYPICFNYRHYLELHLKSLIESSEILYEKMEQLGYLENGFLDEKVSDKLDETHSLQQLMKYFKERLKLISNEIFPASTEKYIMQMHSIDANGQKFRYHKNKKDTLHFPTEERYDIENMSNIMEEVNQMLWGIDGYIDHCTDMSNDMIDEMHHNYIG